MLIIPEFKILFIHIHKNAGRSVKAFLRRSAPKAKRIQDKKSPGLFSQLSYLWDSRRTKSQDRLVYVREWKGQEIYGHESLYNLITAFPELSSYFKFTVVRNPWDRLISAYYWVKGKPSGSPGLNQDDLSRFADFNHFVKELYESFNSISPDKQKVHPFHHPRTVIDFSEKKLIYPSQKAYICDEEGNLLTDALIYQENLEKNLTHTLGPIMGLDLNQLPDLTRVGASTRPSKYTHQYTPETKRMVEEMYAPDIKLFGYQFLPEANKPQKNYQG